MKNSLLQKGIALAFGALLLPLFANAQTPRLEVVFTPDPLFSEANVLPGDTASGSIQVTNNSGETQTVITEAVNVSDPESLSENMVLSIVDDDTNTFWDDTFFDFLVGGPQDLTDPLGDGETVTYTYTVSFNNIDDNDLQLAELGFDLCVGFKDELSGMNCGDSVVSGEGDSGGGTDVQGDGGTTTPGLGNTGPSGGGGGPIDLVVLEIENERVVSIDDDTGTAVIAWETNLFSTSQVVYGLASGGPYSLDTEETNLGYPFATEEDEYKVLSHAVILTGLIPGEEYVYRVVSRASPPTISYAHTFRVEEQVITEEGIQILEQAIEETELAIVRSGGTLPRSNSIVVAQNTVEPVAEEEVSSGSRREQLESLVEELEELRSEDTEEVEETPIVDEQDNNQAAAAFLGGFFSTDDDCLRALVLMLLAIGVLFALYRFSTGRHSTYKEKQIAILLLYVAAILVAIAASLHCVIVYLVIFYIVSFFLQRMGESSNFD